MKRYCRGDSTWHDSVGRDTKICRDAIVTQPWPSYPLLLHTDTFSDPVTVSIIVEITFIVTLNNHRRRFIDYDMLRITKHVYGQGAHTENQNRTNRNSLFGSHKQVEVKRSSWKRSRDEIKLGIDWIYKIFSNLKKSN